MRFYLIVKRIFDILIALICMIIASPLLIFLPLIIRLDSKGPAIFRQKRIGRNGKVFEIWKYRSMRVGAENEESGQYSYEGDPRITRVGRFLRVTSLDELPQLFNILRGEMSVIGPRPVLTYHPWEYADYTEFQRRRFLVRPGVTGNAQVNGRKAIEWNRRIELDIYYIDHLSLGLDLKILFQTMGKLLRNADNVNTQKTVETNAAEPVAAADK